jgi:hypothetical protein
LITVFASKGDSSRRAGNVSDNDTLWAEVSRIRQAL